jgi:hypothetical protein
LSWFDEQQAKAITNAFSNVDAIDQMSVSEFMELFFVHRSVGE